MAFPNLRRAWRRATVRAEAQANGASAAEAKLVADALYPMPGQEPPSIINLERLTDDES